MKATEADDEAVGGESKDENNEPTESKIDESSSIDEI